MSVIAKIDTKTIPTYPLGEPEKNPVFFEKRVYQGSNGKVYPVPFIDKVSDEKTDVIYQRALLENDYVRLEMLPEIGGRIFTGQDKTNGDYDFFYRQDTIKPALVGLAGPWISGGVEFNWPQHHRPGTYLPTDVHIEEEADGARTIWMSEHDPLNRLKGMHGIRLRPDSSLIELRARLYNRTPLVQTFLWWANVAAEVHDRYQSFFPQDVHYVADHAVRATSSFPIADNPYYGIDYQNRPGANELGWYKNIPVPTSYMVCQTNFDFFGGYDFAREGGFVHVANRHIAPGKKQWTWGDDKFGHAWDRELTDEGGPYVELMAGVYTDNQPDFSYLLPYETKTFSQFWWPIQKIGPVEQANQDAALACKIRPDRKIALGLCVSSAFEGSLLLRTEAGVLAEFDLKLAVGEPWQNDSTTFTGENASEIKVELRNHCGALILDYRPVDRTTLTQDRDQATEPPAPSEIASCDELFFVGEHLDQYRHPTRNPEIYWNEALKRDPQDSRCNTALGKRALSRGEYDVAAGHFSQAVARLTSRHPNPVTGVAHYHLGLVHRQLGDADAAYRSFYKSTWNFEWRSCAYYQLATLDCQRGSWSDAIAHLEASLDTNRQHNKAQVLMAMVLHRLGEKERANGILETLLEADPLDHWALLILHGELAACARNDAQTVLDLGFDLAEAGFLEEAIALLDHHHANAVTPVAVPNPMERSPMTRYLLAWLKYQLGSADAAASLSLAKAQPSDHFFPSRLQEAALLDWASSPQAAALTGGDDALAAYGLGNFLMDKRRYAEAIRAWEKAVVADTMIPQVYRNLGIAYWNHERDGTRAARAYERVMELDPHDARLVSEADQLAAKRGVDAAVRLEFLERHRGMVLQRDDATVALAELYNRTGQAQTALDLILSRRFHPWEGGEGAVLRQFTAAHLILGREALKKSDAERAYRHFIGAMDTPPSLGEAYHPLQAKADVNYWIGRSLAALGRGDEARQHFTASAQEVGDFSAMEVVEHSPLSYYRGLSLQQLGRHEQAAALFDELKLFAERQLRIPFEIDYFATSLPNLLVFDEDLQARHEADSQHLIDLAETGRNVSQIAHS